MTTLAYTVPTPGTDLNAIADPEIATALNAIKTWSVNVITTSAWLPLALGTNITASGGAYAPAYRQVGDWIELSGSFVNNTGGTLAANYVIATNLPAPASNVFFPSAIQNGTGGVATLGVLAGSAHLVAEGNGTLFLTGCVVGLDGQRYRVS